MRNVIEKIFLAVMWIVSKMFTYRIASFVRRFLNMLYTCWIRNFIGYIGYRSFIAYPCSLQGGGSKSVKIGSFTNIQSHSVIGCWNAYGNQSFTPFISIGNNCSIGEYNHISACNGITIGDGLLTGRFVYIGDNAHGRLSWEEASVSPIKREIFSKGKIIIGNNVWIGDKATVLAGVTIGDNVIVAANSVVTKNVPSNCIIAGSEGKIVKKI